MSSIIKDFIENKDIPSYEVFLQELDSTPIDELKVLVKECIDLPLTPANIPQYSTLEYATTGLIEYLWKSGNFGPDFIEVGRYFLEYNRKDLAYQKYGENHSKTGALLGLADLEKGNRYKIYLSRLGLLIVTKPLDKQIELIKKLAIRIPIIQRLIKDNITQKNDLLPILEEQLSEQTSIRRLKNCWDLYIPFIGDSNL